MGRETKYCPHAHRCIHPCDEDECFLETIEEPNGPAVPLTKEHCDNFEAMVADYEQRSVVDHIAQLESDNKRLRTALNNCALELHYIHEHGKVLPWKPQFLEIADTLLSD